MSGKESTAIVGLGAATCAVCCAGPVLGFLAATGIGSVLGFALFGVVGLAVAALISVVLSARRRRRPKGCTPSPVTASLDAPTVRSPR